MWRPVIPPTSLAMLVLAFQSPVLEMDSWGSIVSWLLFKLVSKFLDLESCFSLPLSTGRGWDLSPRQGWVAARVYLCTLTPQGSCLASSNLGCVHLDGHWPTSCLTSICTEGGNEGPTGKASSTSGAVSKNKVTVIPKTPGTGQSSHSCSLAFHLLVASSQQTAGPLKAVMKCGLQGPLSDIFRLTIK